ncbi:TadA family conjugal transfer-associated ATPase [Cellulomonas sp. P24]|uniref:TadA family conjugal transfer-associated ATPase n=1 Tax=Cellulomonas sp. P24 TaxID=2885206 RepID=UPI00216AEF9C|nr:TadA family conjugal transfer-associated ATPase [Cellulomonas sp. P24]MCR6493272.1 TadA family conjugal transfer-associated ATPase [Cellulomonas sp. P24]
MSTATAPPPAPHVVSPSSALLVDEVRARLATRTTAPTDADVRAVARECGALLGSTALAEVTRSVRAEILGAGPLQRLLDDPDVTDVLVNAPHEVWVDRGRGLERASIDLGTTALVRALAVRLAAAGGQRLDDASPLVDARLPDGTRLHAVLPPIAGSCTLLSLRVVRTRALTLSDWVLGGAFTPPVAALLESLVRARANLLVTGATGSGKTTLLSTLLSSVPVDERIVCIEESGELAPDHPHVVRLVVRRANVEGAGEVGLSDLVRHAMRMRPDRLVLGECRGAEVTDVLAALNTGHDGGCATMHVNRPRDVPARLAALAALAGMDGHAVAAQAASALHAVVHLRRDGRRRVLTEIAVVGRGADGELSVVPALDRDASGQLVRGPGWRELVARSGVEGVTGLFGGSGVEGVTGLFGGSGVDGVPERLGRSRVDGVPERLGGP